MVFSALLINYPKRAELVYRISIDKFSLDMVGFLCEMILNMNPYLEEFSHDLLGTKSI